MATYGFIVPNTLDAKSPLQAEPDAGDYVILGHSDTGVLLGCDYDVSGNTVRLTSSFNAFIIEGQMYTKASDTSSVVIGNGKSVGYGRFDIAGYQVVSGLPVFTMLVGAESARPVFPEIPDTFMPVVSIYIPADMDWQGTSATEYVTDKRNIILNGAKGAVMPDEDFLLGWNRSSQRFSFRVTGDGTIRFGNESTITPTLARRLEVNGTLYAEHLMGATLNIDQDATIGGTVTAKNLLQGQGPPWMASLDPADYKVGSIYQDEFGGDIYVYSSTGVWKLFYADEYPPGSIISSVLPPHSDFMVNKWLLLDGRSVSEEEAGRLWDLFPRWRNGDRYTLPNMNSTFLSGSSGILGDISGNNNVTLTEANMPRHNHGVSVTSGGSHSHDGSTNSGGSHKHNVWDPGHRHRPDWADWSGTSNGAKWVHTAYGGTHSLMSNNLSLWGSNRPDNINAFGPAVVATQPYTLPAGPPDMSHGYSRVALENSGTHTHPLTTQPHSGHTHNATTASVGGNISLNNQPLNMTVNFYIKT